MASCFRWEWRQTPCLCMHTFHCTNSKEPDVSSLLRMDLRWLYRLTGCQTSPTPWGLMFSFVQCLSVTISILRHTVALQQLLLILLVWNQQAWSRILANYFHRKWNWGIMKKNNREGEGEELLIFENFFETLRFFMSTLLLFTWCFWQLVLHWFGLVLSFMPLFSCGCIVLLQCFGVVGLAEKYSLAEALLSKL